MFNYREFLKKGFIEAIGNKPNYEIILKSAEWCKLGVLLEEDLAEIQNMIDAQYIEHEEEIWYYYKGRNYWKIKERITIALFYFFF